MLPVGDVECCLINSSHIPLDSLSLSLSKERASVRKLPKVNNNKTMWGLAQYYIVKGIVHNFFLYRSNLIFWIVEKYFRFLKKKLDLWKKITLWPLNKEWRGQHSQFLRCFNVSDDKTHCICTRQLLPQLGRILLAQTGILIPVWARRIPVSVPSHLQLGGTLVP